MFDTVYGIASFGSSMPWRTGIAGRCLAGNKRGRREYPCRFAPYRTVAGRQISQAVLEGSRGVYCRDFAVCNDEASLRRQVPGKSSAMLPEVVGPMVLGSSTRGSWSLRRIRSGLVTQEADDMSTLRHRAAPACQSLHLSQQ